MAAPSWETSVAEFVKNEADFSATVIANALVSSEVKLLKFIENLGPYLTSEETSARCRVVRLLSYVLHLLPSDFLSETEVELLVSYMCDRLKDHHTIQPPTLHALLALCHSKLIPSGNAEKICRSIFQEVQNQTLAQKDRGTLYNIIHLLLSKKLQELIPMGADFVLGYIQAMDAEKDPRNLLFAFRCARLVILNFPLGVFTEEMFEVISCYFPIDFTPPSDDPHGIKREDLILALRSCLSASSQFGTFCYPLLLEKLTSDIQTAKIDALQTLAACVEVYGTKSLLEYQSSIFSCIKREVLGSDRGVLETAALNALTAMVTTLTQEFVSDCKTYLEDFLETVTSECIKHLDDTDLRLMKPSCLLLQAAAVGSESASNIILSKLLPRLVQLYYSHTLVKDRTATMECIQGFLSVAKQTLTKDLTVVRDQQTSLTGVLMSAMAESSGDVRLAATRCLTSCLKLPGMLTSEVTVLQVIMDRVFNDEDSNVRSACVDTLSALARSDNSILEEKILPDVISKLHTSKMEVDGSQTWNEHEIVFSILSVVIINKEILSLVLNQLITFMSNHVKLSVSDGCDDFQNVVQCLISIATTCVVNAAMLDVFNGELLPKIYSLLVSTATNTSLCDSCLHIEEVIRLMRRLTTVVVLALDTRKCSEFCSQVSKLLLQSDTSYIGVTTEKHFEPLELSSPWQQTELVSMVVPVICCCPSEEFSSIGQLYIHKLSILSLKSDHKFTRQASTECLAGLVNRWKHGDLEKYLESNLQQVTEALSQSDVCRRLAGLNNLIWITKALSMRGHNQMKNYMTLLLKQLGDADVGLEAAQGFETILSDSCDLLNKSTNATIRMLYKQRLFLENVKKVEDGFNNADQGVKRNYLISLSHMLKALPKQTLISELPQLFPLMVQSLFCEDLDLQLSTMCSLYSLTTEAPAIISKHIDSLIPQLLKLSTYQPSMKVRCQALKCLGVITVLPEHLLLPSKSDVIRLLIPTLDDKKRLVRKEAVSTRTEWFMVGVSNT